MAQGVTRPSSGRAASLSCSPMPEQIITPTLLGCPLLSMPTEAVAPIRTIPNVFSEMATAMSCAALRIFAPHVCGRVSTRIPSFLTASFSRAFRLRRASSLPQPSQPRGAVWVKGEKLSQRVLKGLSPPAFRSLLQHREAVKLASSLPGPATEWGSGQQSISLGHWAAALRLARALLAGLRPGQPRKTLRWLSKREPELWRSFSVLRLRGSDSKDGMISPRGSVFASEPAF